MNTGEDLTRGKTKKACIKPIKIKNTASREYTPVVKRYIPEAMNNTGTKNRNRVNIVNRRKEKYFFTDNTS